MHLTLVKIRRCARKAPRCWFAALKIPIASAGQLFQALLAILVLALYLRVATPEQVTVVAGEWAIWLQAFCIAILGWTVITLLWSPMAVIFEDRRLGKWHGRCFVYREPLLVATIRCHGGSEDQQHSFTLDDPEVGSLVYCSVALHPPVTRTVTPQAFGLLRTSKPPPPGSWSHFRVEPDRMGYVYFHTSGPTSEYTARVYCHQFEVLDAKRK